MCAQIKPGKVKEAHIDAFVRALRAKNLRPLLAEAEGLVGINLIQTVSDPQEFSSLSLWETHQDGEAFFASHYQL